MLIELPIDELGETEFRIFLEYLDREKDLAPPTINHYNSALRFFFEVTLEQTLCYRRLPRKKDPIKVPTAFTRQEILWFLDAIDDSTCYKAIFSLTYGCGLRLSEIRHLRIKDRDKQQMRLFVYQGKGQRDRWIPLSKFVFDDLCTYYKEYKPNHPEGYLFLNGKGGKGDAPISERAIHDCRTSKLGGHIDICPNCGETGQSYNSCRNRHCPKCQTLSKEKWIDARKVDL